MSFVISPAAAQEAPTPLWGKTGLLINDAVGNTVQQNPRIISDGRGGYISVWEDGRSGHLDIFAQKLSDTGDLLWPKNGVAVCGQSANQTSPRLASDGSGGVIIVWQDYRYGTSNIFAQRLNNEGAALWAKDGLPICSASLGQFAPEIIADGSGGAIIAWHDSRGGQGEDIYAQKIDTSGRALWETNGVAVSKATGSQLYPQLASDSSGGAMIVWTDGRAGAGNNNIYAQHIDQFGKALFEKDGLPISSAPNNQDHPAVLATASGAIIAWNDSRAGSSDIYAQKISLDGYPKWEKDGVAACALPHTQENPALSPDGADGVIIVWTDSRTPQKKIYAQRIYADGRIGWQENGVPLCQNNEEQNTPAITKISLDNWVVVFEQGENKAINLYAQKINSASTILWTAAGVPLATGNKKQGSASLASLLSGDFVAVWQDHQSGEADLYAQKLASSGTPLWENGGLVVCAAPGSVIQQNIKCIVDKTGEAILVFEDGRSGYVNIYTQKISKSGSLSFGELGRAVAKVAGNQTFPCIISDGSGGAIIAWQDDRLENYPGIRLQRISADGKNLWGTSLAAATIKAKQTKPVMVADGAGGVIIAWQDSRNPLGLTDIYSQRVSGAGELLWGDEGQPVVMENGNQLDLAMVADTAGGAIIAWTDYRQSDRNPNIYGQRINPAGSLLWPKDGLPVCGAPDVQHLPEIIADGSGGAIIAWTDKGGGSYDIYGQHINASGKPQWLKDGVPICQLARTQQNSKFGNKQIIVWEDFRYGNWDIFAAAIGSNGKLKWAEEGTPIALLAQNQSAPAIINWTNGSCVIAWQDYRNQQGYEIYLQKISADGKIAWEPNGIRSATLTRDGARNPLLSGAPSQKTFYLFWEDASQGGRAIYGQRYLAN